MKKITAVITKSWPDENVGDVVYRTVMVRLDNQEWSEEVRYYGKIGGDLVEWWTSDNGADTTGFFNSEQKAAINQACKDHHTRSEARRFVESKQNSPVFAVTHNGSFHADDVFAAIILDAIFPDIAFVRSRNEEIIGQADIVFDVGGIYDQATRRYDHHQSGRPLRHDGIPYSSVGLIWKDFGHLYLERTLFEGQSKPDMELVDAVWKDVDEGLIRDIDRADNGVGTASPAHIGMLVEARNPSWNEKPEYDLRYHEATAWASGLLQDICKSSYATVLAEASVVKAAKGAADPRIIVLDAKMPWERAIFRNGFTEALYVIHPGDDSTKWYCVAVPVEPGSFEERRSLPKTWCGLRGEEFSRAAGIPDGVFCHASAFICGAQSKESILELARKAIDYNHEPTITGP